MAKRKTTPKTDQAATTGERIAPPPGDAVLTGAVGKITDYYLYGNPALGRLGNIAPRSHWPELTGNVYSLDARLYEVYEEILAKDANISGIISSRVAAVLSRPRGFEPASASALDQAVCDFVRDALDAIGGAGGLDGLLQALLYGIPIGISVIELDWQVSRGGLRATAEAVAADPELSAPVTLLDDAIVPLRYTHLFPGQFVFDRDGQIFLAAKKHEALDRRRLLVLTHNPVYGNPYGVGLLSRLQWIYWFKKQAISFWLRAAERVGSPNLVGSYKGAHDKNFQVQMLALLETLQNSGVAAKPDTWTIDVLHKATEAGEFGKGFTALCEYLDDQAAKAISGSTLTSSEGRRSGSLALGDVHNEIRNEKIEGDARLLMDVLNRQLVRPMVDMNFGMHVPAPRFCIDTSEQENLELESKIDKALLEMGVPLSLDYCYEKYGRPRPGDEDEVLALPITDATLRAGVITQNDVRERWGLPLVAAPASPPAPKKPADGDDDPARLAEDRPGLLARLFSKKKSRRRVRRSAL